MKSNACVRRPLLGCSPLYPPLELIHAAGFHPLVLWELSDIVSSTSASDRHLQPFSCSVARRMSEYLLSPHGKELAGFLFYNACDTIRNLPEVLQCGLAECGRTLPMFRLHLPAARIESDNSRAYLNQEISRLKDELSRAGGRDFSGTVFRQSVDWYRKLRQILLDLESEVGKGTLSFSYYVTLVQQSLHLPVEDALPVVEAELEQASQRPAERTGTRTIVSGILAPPVPVIRAMEESGLRICGNDVASLHRALAYTPAVSSDPEEYYQDFYRNHFPCPTLLYTADRRVNALLRLAQEHEASCFIFVGEKFCEYEYFEYPYLEKRLNAAGIRTLRLEFAMDSTSVEAQKTRIQALADLLAQN